jgi:hypothetical protein
MRFIPILILVFLAMSCQSQTKENSGQTTPAAIPATDASLEDLHWQLRDALRMQLPATHPAERNGQHFKKNYSLDFKWDDGLKTFVIELPEKRLDVETEQIKGGSKYFLPFRDVDVSGLRLIFSEDEKQVSIFIPAKEGKTFLYHPYGNEPDTQEKSVIIGWYDRVQDRTLGRALVLWQQFLMKMGEREKAEIGKLGN